MKPTRLFLALLIVVGLATFAAVGARQIYAGHMPREADQSEREPVTGNACGVERWSVKTGTDAGARSVNQGYHFPTTISRLDALTTPAALPSRSRVRPVESTVYTLDATLLRYKQEADSDYHLVLTDGQNTMIAEIPAAYCTGANSPFLSGIRTARYQFSQHYSVENRFKYTHAHVRITGVGFFDFPHGQSGVATNAIELHPVLDVQFGGNPKPLPPVTKRPISPSPPPSPKGGNFTLSAYVSPASMPYNAYPTLYARTVPGAGCTASVVYSTGRQPRSFDGSTRMAGGNGLVSWPWHEETTGSGGTASVQCTYRGQSKTVLASFGVTG